MCPQAWWSSSRTPINEATARAYRDATEAALDTLRKGMTILGVTGWDFGRSTLPEPTAGQPLGYVASTFVKGVDELAGALDDLGHQPLRGRRSHALETVEELMSLQSCLTCCAVEPLRDGSGKECMADCPKHAGASSRVYVAIGPST